MQKGLFFLLILICLFSIESISQEKDLNPELLGWYQNTLPFYPEVITGGQYSDAPSNYLGSPFYESREFGYGEIWINGITYSRVLLLYDAWKDQVVTFHPIYNQKILIKAEKVEKFILADSSVFIKKSSNPNYGKHNHGFYQIIAEGDPMLLKKHLRRVESVNERGLITKEFREDQDYFFWFREEFRQIETKKEATALLGLSIKTVNIHFREMGLVFKKDPERFLLELLELKKSEEKEFTGFPRK